MDEAKKLVALEVRDGDGFWLYLKRGWKLPGEETHSIVEATRTAAYAKLAEVVKCRCEECRSA